MPKRLGKTLKFVKSFKTNQLSINKSLLSASMVDEFDHDLQRKILHILNVVCEERFCLP